MSLVHNYYIPVIGVDPDPFIPTGEAIEIVETHLREPVDLPTTPGDTIRPSVRPSKQHGIQASRRGF